MYIDESLANGLKERLWNELDDLDIKARKAYALYLRNHKLKLGKRNSYQRLDEAFRVGNGHNILADGMSGSRENPTLLYATLERESKAVISDWEEKMFCIRQVFIDSLGNRDEYVVDVRIGEHAVSRVFQRYPSIYNTDTKDFDIFKIMPEFKSIAFLGQSMLDLFALVSKQYNHSLENISIPFVSNNGLFLGVYNSELNTCDIRTFIADRQLGPDQDALVKQVRAILEENDYYFELLPFSETLLGTEFNVHHYVFFAKLLSVAKQFAELVTWNEKNISFKMEFQRLMINHLSKFDCLNPALKEQEDNRDAWKNAKQKKE